MASYPESIRRKDREEADPVFLKQLAQETLSCSIAVETKEYPLVHVAFFVYDEASHSIVFHFSKHGFAGEQIANGKKVCISIYRYGKLYTAKRAVDFGAEYQSAIIYGKINIIDDPTEKMRDMKIFFDKFFPGADASAYEPFTLQQAHPIHVARVKIERWFGKQHLVPDHAISSFYHTNSPVI